MIYPLPYGVIISGSYKNMPGVDQTATVNYTNAQIAPALGRNVLDLYNVGNSRAPQSLIATYGATWLRPASLLGGRLWKFGAQVDW